MPRTSQLTAITYALGVGASVFCAFATSHAIGTASAAAAKPDASAHEGGKRHPAKPKPRPRCSGVAVKPGDAIQAKIDSRPSGTTFCLAPGKYRVSSALVLKSRDVLDGGGRKAILDGTKDITSAFLPSGRLWSADGQSQSSSYDGHCEQAKPLCTQADDVFYDGRPLTRVGSVADVGPGRFYFDHAAARIYIGNDPVRHAVEATVAAMAVHGWGTGAEGVVIRGLVVQHFAIHGIECRGNTWTVESSEIRWNHGDGLQDCARVLHSSLHDNGKDGYVFGGEISSSTGPYVFSYNTVSRNNYAGYDPGWEAGGAKFMQMAHLTVSHNVVTDNDGNGLWTDWGNRFVTYDSNVVEGNTQSGILHEASYDATISNNVVVGNGDGCTSTLCNSGILLNDSQSVEIFRNKLANNRNGIGMTQIDRGATALGPLTTQNVSVHDNTVSHSGQSGLVQWEGDGSYYTGRNNRFAHNRYLACNQRAPFVWQDPAKPDSYANLSWAQWRAAGNDLTGALGC